MQPKILALHRSAAHSFSKQSEQHLTLVTGEGVDGDAHCGVTVKHRSRVAVDAIQPNLRQVHLVHAEIFIELSAMGFNVASGDIGENITTHGIDLLALPRGTRLYFGDACCVEITGLRNPCAQLDRFQPGLTAAMLGRDAAGGLIRKAGIMGIVIAGGDVAVGDVAVGDQSTITLPAEPHQRLERV